MTRSAWIVSVIVVIAVLAVIVGTLEKVEDRGDMAVFVKQHIDDWQVMSMRNVQGQPVTRFYPQLFATQEEAFRVAEFIKFVAQTNADVVIMQND